jgi:hypothetical protein
MFTKTSASNASSRAGAGSGFQSRAFDERRVGETHSSRIWREELAEMLESNLRHIDARRIGASSALREGTERRARVYAELSDNPARCNR